MASIFMFSARLKDIHLIVADFSRGIAAVTMLRRCQDRFDSE